MTSKRDHGGGVDAAVARWGGRRADWLDLSTGINPMAYPVGNISPDAWAMLPDQGAMDRLIAAARVFWKVPAKAEILAGPGASAFIARMPWLVPPQDVYIPAPTYNEHSAAFRGAWGDRVSGTNQAAAVHVYVHPNNPDGHWWPDMIVDRRDLTVIDESFCDVAPERSHMAQADRQGVVILKSFGKFWGLAGGRLGFAIGLPQTLGPLSDHLGPWAVSGPVLEIGARALADETWADATRRRLTEDAARLDDLAKRAGWHVVGGTSLFRLYEVSDADDWQDRLARRRILSRIFPYSQNWIRLGLPGSKEDWQRLAEALA